VAALLLLALPPVFKSVAYLPFSAPGHSMVPAVRYGDYVYVSRYAYLFRSPQRGDVIVFMNARLNSHFMKRIAGLPGDTIQMQGGVPVINGVAAARREMEPLHMTPGEKPVAQFEETLPGGPSYRTIDLFRGFRDNTGLFEVPEGHYFVLGDNRDDSNDSRFAEFGFIAGEKIEGKVVWRYWSGPEKRAIRERVK